MLRSFVIAALIAVAPGAFATASTPGGPPTAGTVRPPAAPDVAAQRAAMEKLSFLDGTWKGEGWIQMGPERYTFRQTERVGPLQDGSLRLIEGRGDSGGGFAFAAFAVVSFDDSRGVYEFRSYAQGRSGTFEARVPAAGTMVWTMPSPNGQISYTIVVTDGTWRETGEIALPDGRRVQFFEMTLKRTGDARW